MYVCVNQHFAGFWLFSCHVFFLALHSQERVLAVHVPEKQPFKDQLPHAERERRPVAVAKAGDAAEEESGHRAEPHEAPHDVDGDGVHADHREEECPFPEPHHIYDPVEDRQREEGVGGGCQHEGGRPYLLVHRAPGTPCEDERERNRAGGEEDEGLSTS